MTEKKMTFGKLVDSIQLVHGEMAAQASKAVNISLTLRNWIIGCYISEYELRGADRAEYGKQLFTNVAKALKTADIKDVGKRQLHNFHLLYKIYPQIVQTASAQLETPTKMLLNRLSYSHLSELIQIEDSLKRTYYEVACIKGCWSVRELRRQIASLYYERPDLRGKAALECAGKPKVRLRFYRRIVSASKSGIARWLPPHSKMIHQPNGAGSPVYI